MEGRIRIIAPLLAAFALAGCTGGAGSNKVITGSSLAKLPTGDPLVPPREVAPVTAADRKKPKEEKRPPRAETVVTLAGIRERAALGKKKDEPEQSVRIYDEARQLYQEALKTDPSNIKARDGLVRVYTCLGEHHRAQEILRVALEKNPKDARLWVELGMTYNRQKNYDQALVAVRKAIELEPENREHIKVLGYTLVWTGKTSEGVEQLIIALGRAAAHYNVAGILRQQNRIDEARQHLQRCLDADSNFERARDMLTSLRPDAPPAGPGALGPVVPVGNEEPGRLGFQPGE